MNYQDSSSDDIPYLPPEQFHTYEQERNRLSQSSLSQPEQRRGRSQFTEEEIRQLDSPCPFVEVPISNQFVRYTNIDTNPVHPTSSHVLQNSRYLQSNGSSIPPPTNSNANGHHLVQSSIPPPPQTHKISWGRRVVGILLVTIPAVLFSTAAHFIDWSMSDFQLFSSSFFIFQGIFWPSFGILLTDIFCTGKIPTTKLKSTKGDNTSSNNTPGTPKWKTFVLTVIHGNLTAAAIILQILSIQRLNISISLALSFGFDAVVVLFRQIFELRTCRPEPVMLSLLSYVGYGIAAIPAFIAKNTNSRFDTAVGISASVGVMVLSIPASLLLPKLRQAHVSEPMLGTSFAFFGCIHSLITKEIMGSTFNLALSARAVGWAAGLISVVFLGTIFLFLETKLSSLIWQRDDDLPRQFSSITRTRVAVFILSCLWELSRQGFRDTAPELYDVLGGFLVMISFLLVSGYEAWSKSCQNEVHQTDSVSREQTSQKIFAFIPWLFAQKSNSFQNEK